MRMFDDDSGSEGSGAVPPALEDSEAATSSGDEDPPHTPGPATDAEEAIEFIFDKRGGTSLKMSRSAATAGASGSGLGSPRPISAKAERKRFMSPKAAVVSGSSGPSSQGRRDGKTPRSEAGSEGVSREEFAAMQREVHTLGGSIIDASALSWPLPLQHRDVVVFQKLYSFLSFFVSVLFRDISYGRPQTRVCTLPGELHQITTALFSLGSSSSASRAFVPPHIDALSPIVRPSAASNSSCLAASKAHNTSIRCCAYAFFLLVRSLGSGSLPCSFWIFCVPGNAISPPDPVFILPSAVQAPLHWIGKPKKGSRRRC
jgi:hypothetical protein